MKRILITGANSYIGESVREHLLQEPDKYYVETKDTMGWIPSPEDFKGIDVVFNVAGIAHIKETKENRHLYYDINRDLVVNIAKAAKVGGVKQFILLSTMSVYGVNTGHIKKSTIPKPVNAYGKSKLEADKEIKKLECNSFKFACLRPPMVYGKGCKGNYQRLRSFALKSPIFPSINNKRSMIYIGNLCDFIKDCINNEKGGLFFPQNSEYVNTSQMVREIAARHEKNIIFIKGANWAIRMVPMTVVKKVFGNLTYEPTEIISKYDFLESIELSEQ